MTIQSGMIAERMNAQTLDEPLSRGMIRVDGVELDDGGERVLELLVAWIVSPGGCGAATRPAERFRSCRS